MKKEMTERMLEIRVKKINELQAQIDELTKAQEKLKTELKDEMTSRGVDEMTTKHFKIRWKEVISNRLDTNRIKTERPEIYKEFLKATSSRRFTIA